MKLALVSDHETRGGAAQAASRFAAALCHEHEVVRLVQFPDPGPHPWHTRPLGRLTRLDRWLRGFRRRVWPGSVHELGTPEFALDDLLLHLLAVQPDIINLHNLHGGTGWGWTPHLAAACLEIAPVVWTLHDMWSFTGRCAYAYDCDRFVHGCDERCPTPNEPPSLVPERIATAWDERRRMFARHPELVAVTPSRWLAREAERGLWAGHRIEVIPYGVPTDVFLPLPRAEARRQLGVPNDAPVVLLAAHDLTERRKGAGLLPHLWPNVQRRPLTVLTVGHGSVAVADTEIRVQALGWVGDGHGLALAYNAADVVLHPAPVDNFPNVLLEALACGTPAVGLPVGGVPELIRPGVTGWLAVEVSVAALGQALDAALADAADLREVCRAVAVAEYPLELQARRYEALFAELRQGR